MTIHCNQINTQSTISMASIRTILRLLIGVIFIVNICDCLTPSHESEIETLIRERFMARNNIPGVGVTIVENFGSSVFARGYGFADLERNSTANENTKFCIASITKVSNTRQRLRFLFQDLYGDPGGESAKRKFPGIRIRGNQGQSSFNQKKQKMDFRFRYESMSFRDLLSHRHGLRTESLGSSAGAYKDIDEFT